MNGPRHPLIVCDPGHGGRDPGAVNELLDLREADLNLLLARAFRSACAGACFDVLLLRETDIFLSLEDRARLANEAGATAFLSFHCNAAAEPGADGYEVWTTRGQTPADRLSTLIYTELLLGTLLCGREDLDDGDPDREADFYVLRHTTMPAVLVECGFITNESDAEMLMDPEGRNEIVTAICAGVKSWLKEIA